MNIFGLGVSTRWPLCRRKIKQGVTYDRRTLQDRRAPVENKDRFYSPEEELADPAQETEDMSVEDHAPVLTPHRSLELVDPYAGIYCEGLSL
jgi:hypothetical protein